MVWGLGLTPPPRLIQPRCDRNVVCGWRQDILSFRVWGSGFGDEELGSRYSGFGFRVQDLGCVVQAVGLRVKG